MIVHSSVSVTIMAYRSLGVTLVLHWSASHSVGILVCGCHNGATLVGECRIDDEMVFLYQYCDTLVTLICVHHVSGAMIVSVTVMEYWSVGVTLENTLISGYQIGATLVWGVS